MFKEQAGADTFPAPRLQIGNAIWSVTSVDDALAKVREFKQRGIDWLAVHSPQRFKRAELEAMVAFYGSEVGASTLAKTQAFNEAYLAAFSTGLQELQITVENRIQLEVGE